MGTDTEEFIFSIDADGGWVDFERTKNAVIYILQKEKSLENQEIRMPYPSKKSFIFMGWKDRDTGEDFWFDESTVISKDTYIIAKWAKSVELTFDANGGRFTEYSCFTTKKNVECQSKCNRDKILKMPD